METIADRLRGARRRRFVGRKDELRTFRRALGAAIPPFAVMHVHGPGGVGKTALLDALAAVAEEQDAAPVLLDARSADTSRTALCAAAVWPEPVTGRRVLLLDSYERLAAMDDWVREEFLPALPAGTLVVIAGREPPRPDWVSDPGWRELLRAVPLANLPPDEGAALLRAENVPDRLHGQVLAATHGHPLALALLADVLAQRENAGDLSDIGLGDAPDVVRLLLDRFLEEVPSPRHRRALDVCALALVTTEEMLRAVLDEDDDAAGLFAWLRRLSFVDERPDGLRPHDLARGVLDTDLRWRDRGVHRLLFERVRRHLAARLRGCSGAVMPQIITELAFLKRVNPALRDPTVWPSMTAHRADETRADDRAALVAMTERYEGPESARLAAFWMERQPSAFVVARDADGVPAGYACQLRLDLASPEDLEVDPGAGAMWAYVRRHGPTVPGEAVVAHRFFVDREEYQSPVCATGVVIVEFLRRRLTSSSLSWDLIGAYRGLHARQGVFCHTGYHRAEEADFEVAGLRHPVYARDFRPDGLAGWLTLMAEGEMFGAPPSDASPLVTPPSRTDFASSVRRALRDLHRPEALTHNPLNAARAVRSHEGGLAGLLHEAATALGADPRGLKAYRAVDRTYLRPAPTQERAAELLGLPFSTYRRHLRTGVDRIVETLWQRELYGSRVRS
ncbi:AAA family ATPase [Thermomonospora umbrina]|nr:AAA family ATPase [Thermomonospora umbrina]